MSTANILVFHKGQLHGSYSTEEWKAFRVTCDQEIYADAYVRIDSHRPGFPRELELHEWIRIDGTEIPENDIPKELKAMILLLL